MGLRKQLLVIATFLYASSGVFSQDKTGAPEEKKCIELKGLAYVNNVATGSYTVTLYEKHGEVKTIKIGNPRIFEFSLKRNSIYSMVISKKGYVNYMVWINTYFPADQTDCNYKFTNEIYLIEENPDYDNFYLDFPIAVFEYNNDVRSFIFNEAYTEHIKKMMKITNKRSLFKKQ